MKRKNLTPIYLKAMERIEMGSKAYSCEAINYSGTEPENLPARKLYAEIFSPNKIDGCIFALNVNSGPDPKSHRLTMLALASVCWRDFV